MNELHTFQCPACKTVATTTIKPSPGGAPAIRCSVRWCQRTMRFLFSTEVEPAVWEECHRQPIKFTTPQIGAVVPPEDREKRCARQGCRVYRKKADLLNGRFCSEECGALDSLDQEAYWQRIEALREKYPYIDYPRRQESA